MTTSRRLFWLARPVVIGVGVLSLVGPSAFAAGPATTTPAPTTVAASAAPVAATPGVSTQTVVAAAKNRMTPIYATPDAKTPKMTLDNRKNFSGRHVFVVLGQAGNFYQVKVASRPNGNVGWVNANDVTLYQHDYAITVQLSTHTLIAYKAGKEFLRTTVAVGQAKYPTPTGSYFIRELARPANPGGAYGPYAFGLSAYSNVLTSFGRGDGQIGIHGTNRPKELGTNASHGCVRVPNAVITKLAQTLPQGVPVEIVA